MPYSSCGVPAAATPGTGPSTHGMRTPSVPTSNTCPIVPLHAASVGGVKVMLAIVHLAPASDIVHVMLPLGSANDSSACDAEVPDGEPLGMTAPDAEAPGVDEPAVDDERPDPAKLPVSASASVTRKTVTSTASTAMKIVMPRLSRVPVVGPAIEFPPARRACDVQHHTPRERPPPEQPRRAAPRTTTLSRRSGPGCGFALIT